MHHSVAQSRGWAEKGQHLAKTETCRELLVNSQLCTLPCIFMIPLIPLAGALLGNRIIFVQNKSQF